MTTASVQPEAITAPRPEPAPARRVRRPRRINQTLTARPNGTRPPVDLNDTAVVPPGLGDTRILEAVPGSGGRRARAAAVALPVLGLACVGGGLYAAGLLGEFGRMGLFLAQTPQGFFSAIDEGVYPSAQAYLGLLLSGPAGGLFFAALGLSTCLGLVALQSAQRLQPTRLNRVLPLVTALLLPLLVLDFMVYSAIEFATAQTLPHVLADVPGAAEAWVLTALACTAVICLASNGLLLGWAWRREKRLAARQAGHRIPEPL